MFQENETLSSETEENPGAIIKSPSSPVGSRLLLRKNAMQAEQAQSSSLHTNEWTWQALMYPRHFTTKLLMRKHDSKEMDVISLDTNENDTLFQERKP